MEEVAQTLEELEAMYSDEDKKKKKTKLTRDKVSKTIGEPTVVTQQPARGKGKDNANAQQQQKVANAPTGNGEAKKADEDGDTDEDGGDGKKTTEKEMSAAKKKRLKKKEKEMEKKAEGRKAEEEKEDENNVEVEEEKSRKQKEMERKERLIKEGKLLSRDQDRQPRLQMIALHATAPVEAEYLLQQQQVQNKKPDEEAKPEEKKDKEKPDEEDDIEGNGGGGTNEKEMSAAKKKKLKKKEKEKEKKAATGGAATVGVAAGQEGKKPTSAVAKLIKQQLERQREEEEKLRKQEEEAERKREEERLRREEEERIERERKERRKLKEKERKKRLKEEGKLLTQKQKQDRLRLQQMIEQSGVELPAAAAPEEAEDQPQQQQVQKKKPKYEKLKRPKHFLTAAAAAVDSVPQQLQQARQEQERLAANVVADSWEDAAASETTWERIESGADQWKPVQEKEEVDDGESDEENEDNDDEDDDESTSSANEEDDSDSREGNDGDKRRRPSASTATATDDIDPMERARQRIALRRETALAQAQQAGASAPLRCPLVCVLGHVDTGKTSILDKLRKTHVQDGEAGGITQQIGATNVPAASILAATRMVKSLDPEAMTLPGLLIIDTPGHESFSNLRSRGSSLCDVAILVVDIMHGIEPQTVESIQLLKARGTPFIVALNKIDRLYDWQKNANADVFATLKKQSQATRNDFEDRLKKVVADFAMQELNVCLSVENKNFEDYISLVPTSAHSGDGMGNLMAHICELSLKKLRQRLAYHEDLEATVMEVKEITGLGTTIDVCLVNGRMREGDTIILAGQEGPIVTQVRGLLMPMPMKEFRVKNQYDKYKEVKGAQAVKVIAKDLEKALAGLPIYASKDSDEIEVYKIDVSAKLSKVLKSIEVQDIGVYVQASTLGSLEALLLFLRTEKIPYCGINIGPVHKRDVTKCSIMLEKDPQWAVILAFDVKVEREAQELADSHGVRIFTADIIYHLSDAFMKYREDLAKAEREKYKDVAVFPCKLRILPQFIFNTRDPIVCGVSVEAGILKVGSPISVPSKECIYLGRVESLELNHKKVEEVKRGAEVCVKIAAPSGEAPKMYGRHFDHNDLLMSRMTRESIDALKQHFRDDLSKDDWKLVIEMKKAFNVL